MQIAFSHRVYVLDGLKTKNKPLQTAFQDYIGNDRPLIGHALTNDLDALLFSLGVSLKDLPLFKFKNTIDTGILFKAIYPKDRYSNLAHICQTVLKK